MADFTTDYLVQFRDTDSAGIMHFSAFFTYMEQAEHALLRHLGSSVVTRDELGKVSWPRVSAHCDFAGSLSFEEAFRIVTTIEKIGTKSVTYAFEFICRDQPVATGTVTSVCCRIEPGQRPQSMQIPERFRDKLEAFQNQ